MGSSLVPVMQVAVTDPWLATPRHAITKEDSTIAAQLIWKNTPFKDPPLFGIIDNKRTSRFLESSTKKSLRLDELLATTLGGREAPCHGGQSELEVDSFEVSCLIRKLALFGDLEKVTEVFGNVSRPDAYIWSALISAHSNLGANAQAINLYHQMVNSNATPDGHVFVAVLKACSSLVDLNQGMQIHSYIIKSGFDSDIFISNTLIGMYAKCGNLEDAHMLFKKITHWRDAVTWSVLIAGYAELGYPLKAYGLFQQMQQEGMQPNQFTFVCVLKACSNMGEGNLGERIHSHIIENGCELDLFVGNALMDMYIKCDGFDNACTLMNKLLKRDVVTWSAIIGGYAQRGVLNETFQAFQEMQEEGIKPDVVTYVCLMKACRSLGALEQGRKVHSQIIESGFESDLFVGSAIVDMYVKCENLEDAHTVFGRLSKRNAVTWNTLIGGYSQYGHCQKAYQIFQQMEQAGLELDKVTFVCLVSGCSWARDLEHGKQVHCHLVQFGAELDVAVGNALIDMYSKCGSLEDACILFDRLPRQDVVTWNILITWHAQNRLGKEVLHYFERMQQEGIEPNQVTWNALIAAQSQLGLAVNAVEVLWQMQQGGVAPDKFTFVRVLQMCSMIGALEQGMQLHNDIIRCGFESDMFIQNTLIDMYAKCDNLEAACMVFDRLPSRDVVAWNALIAGLTMHGHAQESLKVFQNMQQESVEPDRVTFVAILQACSSIAVLEHGKRIHDHITESGFELDLYVSNTLIDMYAKCGSMDDALFLFNRLPKQDEVTWSTLIAGHAQHCNYLLASQCFWGMQEAGFLPNEGTYLSLLSACSRASLVNEGCFYFKSMQEDHGIVPTLEHHVALVELLGRAGYVREAEELLETLPWGSNIVGWTSLLGSCKKYGLVDLGKQCFDRLITMRNGSSSGYVLMSGIYAHVGLDEAAEEVAVLRKHANVWKQPAKAYIEIGSQVHDFAVGDTTHARSDEIYAKLGKLITQLKEEGYSPRVGLVHEASSVKLKEKSLWGHSEKLAMAFGLLCTPGGMTIRVAKNLRVCADCHDVAMSISKLETRDIIIKDSHCIHHFKDGACCCNEYQ